MKTYICKTCGNRYNMDELPDYDGECIVCGAEMPKDEKEYDKDSE